MPQKALRRSMVMALLIFYVGTRWHTGRVCLSVWLPCLLAGPSGYLSSCAEQEEVKGSRWTYRGWTRNGSRTVAVAVCIFSAVHTNSALLLCTKLSTSNYNLISRRGKSIFSCPVCPHLCWGPPSLLLDWYQPEAGGGGVLCPGCDVYHSPPCRTDTH
jgi:hypothetical protein